MTKQIDWQRVNRLCAVATLITFYCSTHSASAFVVNDAAPFGLGIARWNAEPHFVDGVERSLDGGLRYALVGGTYEGFRDQFQWEGSPPSVNHLQAAVEQAFAVWEAFDTESGLNANFHFVHDVDTPAFLVPFEELEKTGVFRLNPGAEIDIGGGVNFTEAITVSLGDPDSDSVTLTSGVTNYPAAVMSGIDIRLINNIPWTLDRFQKILSHEIGLALGLADTDLFLPGHGGVASLFYDDNFDNTNSDTALATLTNSFAHLIDPLDPNNSPGLQLFELCTGGDPVDVDSCVSLPGIDTLGVDLLMESSVTEGGILQRTLQNDEFAGRQFLYPYVRVDGDFDGDELLTNQDMDLLSAEARKTEPRVWFDLNDDGMVNGLDRVLWVESLVNTSFGDADLNGKVEFADFLSLSSQFGMPGGWAAGDFDGNGDVQFADFLILSRHFGESSAAVVVPETNVRWLLLIGSAGLGARLRKRTQPN